MLTRITNDLTIAMKSGDKFTLSVLRMLKSALKNEEINKKAPLTDDEILAVIRKQVKVRKDSKAEYEEYQRVDLATDLAKEIEILNKYLPAELAETDLIKIIDEVINESGASDIKAMGSVMKMVGAKVGVAADMGLVSKLVKERLGSL